MIAAAAITTGVLTGALVVGDSVRGSLRALTLDRLGEIDYALLSESFFRGSLAGELIGSSTLADELERAAPLISLQGSAVTADSEARSSQVSIYGIDGSFSSMFSALAVGSLDLSQGDGQLFPSLVINESLQRELGVAVGEQVVLSLARPSDVPRESLLGSTESGDLIQTLRAQLVRVIPDRGAGRFSLAPHQSLPLNAFVDLAQLQRSLDQRDRINALLISRREGAGGQLGEGLVAQLTLDDLGLVAAEHEGTAGGTVEVTSREILLRPALEAAIRSWAGELGASVLPVSTYLANRTRVIGREGREVREHGEETLPYSTIAALDVGSTRRFGGLELRDGSLVEELGPGQVLVNEWAAEDLAASPGDRVEIEYWEVGEREELVPRSIELEVAGVVALERLGADRGLTPPFPGVHDAEDMADWEPTFPVDLGLIGERDEDYWDRYGATPKLFVAEELGRRLWGSRFGALTSLRLATDDLEPAALIGRLREELPGLIDPRSAGITAVAVKEQGLRAASGATDFAGLFLGFSLFLIVAAAMLVALFFRLGIESRVKEIGARLALGFALRSVRRSFLAEGAILAALGGLLGLGVAIAHAGTMVLALRTLWVGATGTRFLSVHLEPLTLVAGFGGSLIVVMWSIWRTVRRLARHPVTALLKGSIRLEQGEAPRRLATRVAAGGLVLAVALFAASFVVPTTWAAPLFIALGAVLVAVGLALFALALRGLASGSSATIATPGAKAVLQMAAANASLSPGRSLLSVALVACACFVIVAVGAYGHRFGEEVFERTSGTGGFPLVAESDVPIYHDLNDPEGRFELGFNAEAERLLAASAVVPLRVLPGDDVSCLNLYQPERPRLLGAPRELIERGGFGFQQVASKVDNPWKLLEEPLADGAIPAIGDFNSVMWILHSGLGKDIEMLDESGEPIRLRIVGLLRRSIFQSELVVSERLLLEHFPSRSGYNFFLVEPPHGEVDATAAALERTLGRFGLDTTSTAQRLASYQAVENTYLGTFQALGGLGLLLGTVGLAVILLRNVLERAAELATLRAVGFRRATLGWMVVSENVLVLVAGLVIGAVAALVAVSPHLRGGQALVPWGGLSLTLLAVLGVGTLACAAAVRQALRIPLLPALRAE